MTWPNPVLESLQALYGPTQAELTAALPEIGESLGAALAPLAGEPPHHAGRDPARHPTAVRPTRRSLAQAPGEMPEGEVDGTETPFPRSTAGVNN